MHILIARPLSFHMKDSNIVPYMQYGSREEHQSISAILNKQLTHDIVRHKKSIAAFIENDAIRCYDRMVNNLLLLQLLQLGLPVSAVSSLADTWSNTTHHIKSKYGISDATYKSTTDIPLFGPEQGSTLGPFLWLILFSLMVSSLLPNTPSATFASADHNIFSNNVGEAFIDDSFLGVTILNAADQPLSSPSAYRQAEQQAITSLSSLAPGELTLTSGQATEMPITVPRIEPLTTYRTLGVRLSPSGQTTQVVTKPIYETNPLNLLKGLPPLLSLEWMSTGPFGNTIAHKSVFLCQL